MTESRTRNVFKNSWVSLATQVLNTFVSFFNRTVFIHVLSIEYLGVNGLFLNVLKVLSFAELGIGNAILFHLYKPIAINEKERIKSLMSLYANVSKIIALFIFVSGLLLIPFMDYIIKEKPEIDDNLILIYIMFLFNTSVSYLFKYKASIIQAYQKKYIVELYKQGYHILQVAFQILILFLTKDFILYLSVQVIFTVLHNLMIARKANKLYPFLTDRKVKKLEIKEKRNIFRDVKALMLYRFGSVILYGTDNIMISALIGLASVGIVSNYILIIGMISTLLSQIKTSFLASIGNLNAVGSVEKKEAIFEKIFFINAWLYGFSAIGLLTMVNPLISIWLGNDFVLSEIVVFAIVLHYYIDHIHYTIYSFRVTTGIFVHGRVAPLIASILNISLSIWLGKTIGLSGIFFATSISRLLTMNIVDPILVYKKIFNKNPLHYYLNYFGMAIIFTVLYFSTKYILAFVDTGGISGFVLKVMLVTIFFNLMMVIIFYRSRKFKELKKTFIDVFRKKTGF